MAYTETTTTSWTSRLGGSIKGVKIGAIMFIIATVLIFWNEGRTVKQAKANEGFMGVMTELTDISKVDPAMNGKAIHATGLAKTDEILKDEIFGISENAVRLVRSVQYYQWIEHASEKTEQKLGGSETTTTTYTYSKEWVGKAVDSSRFHDPEYKEKNAGGVRAAVEDKTLKAEKVSFGAYFLSDAMRDQMRPENGLVLDASAEKLAAIQKNLGLGDMVIPAKAEAPAAEAAPAAEVKAEAAAPAAAVAEAAAPAAEAAPAAAAVAEAPAAEAKPAAVEARPVAEAAANIMVHVIEEGKVLYIGKNPNAPEVGDLRVTFSKVDPSATVSMLAQVSSNTFKSYADPDNGYTVMQFDMGEHSAQEMYKQAQEANSKLCWILRVIGLLLAIGGISNILKPLSVLASVVPMIGRIISVGTGLIAKVVGTAWILLVGSIAWVFYRPAVGIPVLIAAIALAGFAFTKIKGAKAPAPAPADGGATPPAA